LTAVDPGAAIKAGEEPRGKDEAMEERSGTPCPQCRRGNPPENRFCGACGAPLTSGELPARWPEAGPTNSLPAARRGLLLPAELKPVGGALAVGLAALAARAGLAWLRRRAEGSDRPLMPAAEGTGPAPPERLLFESFEEIHVWLQEGDVESRGLARRAVTAFRTTDLTGERRVGP
jgi:hypothetical protein